MTVGGYLLQFGSLAGWPFRVAAGLRAAGYGSRNVIAEEADVADLDRKLPYDRAIARRSQLRPVKLARRAAFVAEAARDCSLVHYHGGVIGPSRLHPYAEGRIFDRAGIPMLMSFGGGDARNIAAARSANPYFYLDPDPARDARTHSYLSAISKRIRFVATDCEMIPYVERYFDHCFIFRQPVDIHEIAFNEPRTDSAPVVLHVPTHPWAKGTDNIVAAVERLRGEGVALEFRMKRQLTQSELYREISECDIYVDELRCGSHGVTAVETMAAGKPTVTFIRPDLVPSYPSDMPIISANPDTIYNELRHLVCDAALRRDLSYRSRAYAEKYHSVDVVVQDLLAIYREIGWRG